jgi:hypothetical protein
LLNSVAKGLGLALVLVCCLFVGPQPSWADWICDGDRLSVEITRGAVDVTGLMEDIPNSAEGTLPGDGVLVRWRDMTLQLPRTNNAGSPSYTDGRWWWRVADASSPEFFERRGSVIRYQCELI